jgi:hypothetical protein
VTSYKEIDSDLPEWTHQLPVRAKSGLLNALGYCYNGTVFSDLSPASVRAFGERRMAWVPGVGRVTWRKSGRQSAAGAGSKSLAVTSEAMMGEPGCWMHETSVSRRPAWCCRDHGWQWPPLAGIDPL